MMSGLLTTGEMIDRLKIGEKAEPMEYPIEGAFQKDYVLNNGNKFNWSKHGSEFVINSFTNGIKWRILPNYVSFEEAMKALKEGKLVEYHSQHKSYKFHKDNKFILTEMAQDNFLFHDLLLEGKWTIQS